MPIFSSFQNSNWRYPNIFVELFQNVSEIQEKSWNGVKNVAENSSKVCEILPVGPQKPMFFQTNIKYPVSWIDLRGWNAGSWIFRYRKSTQWSIYSSMWRKSYKNRKIYQILFEIPQQKLENGPRIEGTRPFIPRNSTGINPSSV